MIVRDKTKGTGARLYLTEEVIERYSPRLFRLCFFLCQNENDANDVLQETWVKIMRNIGKYDEGRDFGKWASAVCVNTFRDMYRKNKRRRFVEFTDTEAMEKFLNSLPADGGEAPTPDEYITLYHAIGVLTPKMRTVTVLHYFSGYSEKECSQILGISANKVKSRLYSARQSLKRSLEQ